MSDYQPGCNGELPVAPTNNLTNELTLIHQVCRFIRGVQAMERGIEDYPCAECPLNIDTPYGKGMQGCVMHAQELIEIVRGHFEPNGDEWRSPVTAPKDQDCLFSLRPITKDDPYFVDTSGNPILGKSEPRVIVSRYGRWSSLEVMMGWMPLPQPLNRVTESL